jgi:hypothetical protein
MSEFAAIVACLALVGAVASWIAGARIYAAAAGKLSASSEKPGWLAVAAWPFGLRRIKGAALSDTVQINKALIAFFACLTVAVAATSVATNLARVSR